LFCFVCWSIDIPSKNQKEEIKKLLAFKKEKFEKEIQLNEEDEEYQEKHNQLFDKNEEIKNIILSSKKKAKSSKSPIEMTFTNW
jgi:hypothetical protein